MKKNMLPILWVFFSYYTPIGIENICPSEITFPTKVEIYGSRCYIVKPELQCISYAKCAEQT